MHTSGGGDSIPPRATRERVHSVLVSYPEEGHGVRKWPAVIDFAARFVMWFEEHLRVYRDSATK
jgi:hypothetical protein